MLINVPHIARIHPPVPKRLPRRLLVIQIPQRHTRAREHQLALLPDLAPAATVRLADARGGAGDEAPRGARLPDAHVDLREGDGRAGLGHAVPLADGRVGEHVRDLVHELGGERGCAGGERLYGGEVVVLGGGVLGKRKGVELVAEEGGKGREGRLTLQSRTIIGGTRLSETADVRIGYPSTVWK